MSGTVLGPRDAMKQKHAQFLVGEWGQIFGTKEIGKTKVQRQENANQNVAVTLGKKRQLGRQLEAWVGGFECQAVSLNFLQGLCGRRGPNVEMWGS